MLWETAKAVLKGRIISFSSYRKKKEIELENNSVQNIYDLGKYLSNQLKQKKENSIIPAISNPDGNLHFIVIYTPLITARFIRHLLILR